jgi:CDGSH-type Zn-finger protein/uncharacterized Fe-S cluster protein YjdI
MADKPREYEGRDVVVQYDVKRCIHAEVCVRGLPSVFQRERRPWVDADGASAADIGDVVMRCPTGALHFRRRDSEASEPVPQENTATLEVDGPVYVKGDLEIVDAEGSLGLADTRIALCRCGASENKPFCDGRHTQIGFTHAGDVAGAKPEPEGFTPAGKLSLEPRPNGPVVLRGSFEVRSADGKTSSFHDARASLCRCGASQKKPFCDGTHKKIGFVAD